VPDAPPAPPLLKELFHHLLVEVFGAETAGGHPAAQPGYGAELLLPGVEGITELSQLQRKAVEIVAQRPDAKSLTRGVGAEVLVHGALLLVPFQLEENTRDYAERFTAKNERLVRRSSDGQDRSPRWTA
jgi:hypothetical protein